MNIDPKEVIKKLSITNRGPCKQLLGNPRNSIVHFTGSAYYRISKNGKDIRLSGLLPVLKTCFWPNTNINTIMSKKRKKDTNNDDNNKTQYKKYRLNNGSYVTIKTPVINKSSSDHGRGKHFGLIRGTKIHEQLNDYILFDKPNFLKKHINIHPWTKKIFGFIKSKGWCPLVGEFNLYDPALNMGTSVDIVFVSMDTGHLILLEIKTGYNGYFEENDGCYMEGPLNGVLENSPINWAILQIVFSTILVVMYHKIELTYIEAWVLRIDTNDIQKIKIENNIIKQY